MTVDVEKVQSFYRRGGWTTLLEGEWEWGRDDEASTVVGVTIGEWHVWASLEADRQLVAYAENDSHRAGKTPAELLTSAIFGPRPAGLPVRYVTWEDGMAVEVYLANSLVPGESLTFRVPVTT